MNQQEQEILNAGDFPKIDHMKADVLRRAKKSLADVTWKEWEDKITSPWFRPEELLFFYMSELLYHYREGFGTSNENEIFDFLRSLALRDLSSLGIAINIDLFQGKTANGTIVEEEIRCYIRFILDVPELLRHTQAAVKDIL